MTYVSRLWLGVALACSACVVGQGHGDGDLPSTPSSLQPERSSDAGAGAHMAAAGASGATAAGARADGTGGALLDSGVRDVNTSDGKRDGGRAADHDAAIAKTKDSGTAKDTDAECAPAVVEVCNPVTNEGCLDSLDTQCAVDLAATLTGYCIFNSADSGQPAMTGGDCLNTGVTESCLPTFTCMDSQCRKLCFCGTDCEAGQCCKEPIDSTGFNVCGDC